MKRSAVVMVSLGNLEILTLLLLYLENHVALRFFAVEMFVGFFFLGKNLANSVVFTAFVDIDLHEMKASSCCLLHNFGEVEL